MLSQEQIKAAINLSQGMSVNDVAANAGRTRRTIDRWLATKEFKDYLQELRNRLIDSVSSEKADFLLKIQEDQLKCYQTMKRIALEGLRSPSLSARDAFLWCQILDRGCIGEGRVSFLNMLEINQAIGVVQKAGYEVFDPTIEANVIDDEEE